MTERSARNPAVQHLRRLARRRSARSDANAFLIGGPVLVGEALAAGIEVQAAYVDAPRAATGELDGLVDRLAGQGVRMITLGPGVLEAAVDTVTSQGVVVIARPMVRPLRFVTMTASGFVLVLAGVADPGNAGTLLRSAEAFGAKAVVVTDGSVDLFAPKTVRAAAGSLFRVPVVVGGDLATVAHSLRTAGYSCLATVARSAPAPEALDLTGPTAIVLGNEAHGLTAVERDLLDAAVTIPMAGDVESLNVAMAGTVLGAEVARQHRAANPSTVSRSPAVSVPTGVPGSGDPAESIGRARDSSTG